MLLLFTMKFIILRKFLTMKKTLFIATLLGTSVAFSQSLTQANEPSIGATQTMFLCDPTADPYASTTGTGVTWDYSDILSVGGQQRDVTIEDATTDPNYASFPGAVKTIKVENALTTFMSSTSSERISQGFVYTEPSFGEVIATFDTDNEKLVDYPFSNGSSLTDTYAGSLSFEFNGVPQNPSTTGNAYAWIDGEGTFIQSDGTSLSNVIRYKLIDTSYANITLFGNIEVIRMQYEYYDLANNSLPVFTYSRVLIQQMGGGTPLTDQIIVLSQIEPTAYVNVDETAAVDFTVFPNPTTGEVIIKGEFEGNGTVEVLDNSGRLLNSMALSTGMTVNLSSYDTGMYMVRITNNGLTTTKTVVKR